MITEIQNIFMISVINFMKNVFNMQVSQNKCVHNILKMRIKYMCKVFNFALKILLK